MEKNELTEEMLSQISGGSKEEWMDLRAWVIRHNPNWAGRDPETISDGAISLWLHRNIPEYDGYASRENEPADYFVNNADKRVMSHSEFMALLANRYGA